MKTMRSLFLGVILSLGLHSIALSQLKNVDFLKGGVNDAELLFQEYLRPYANIFGANLNAGWYNTGKPHKALGKLTPKEFKNTIDNEDNSASNLPLSTVNQINYKRDKSSIKKVNVI